MNHKIIDVLLAVIKDEDGRYLIAQRQDPCRYAGFWEFPGGKKEPGELRLAALQRECKEELGVEVLKARPLFQWSYKYPDRHVRLDAWLVQDYSGKPHGAEGQSLRWLSLQEFDQVNFLEANKIMNNVLSLPESYAITPEFDQVTDFYAELEELLAKDISLLQFRAKKFKQEDYKKHAKQIAERCLANKVIPLFNSAPEFVQSLPGAGLHLDSTQLMSLKSRPISSDRWLSASCHNTEELSRAELIGADMALLSPVLPTSTHAHGPTLGWQRLEGLVAEVNIPVYALGGLSREHTAMAHNAGCQGIASISAFWRLAKLNE